MCRSSTNYLKKDKLNTFLLGYLFKPKIGFEWRVLYFQFFHSTILSTYIFLAFVASVDVFRLSYLFNGWNVRSMFI